MLSPYIINDFVIKEDSCNMGCSYCLTGQSLFKNGHDQKAIFCVPQKYSYQPGTKLYANLKKILEAVLLQDVPLVKISGGEIMLIQNIMKFIEEISLVYEKVIILTNGTLLDKEKIYRLKELKNVIFQISLDSTVFLGNSYRIRSEDVHQKVINKIHLILESKIPTEIYLTINNRSIETLEQTLHDLVIYAGHLTVYPFPLRGPAMDRFYFRDDQICFIENIIFRRKKYQSLLPLEPYLASLLDFCRFKERKQSCHLPRVSFSTFDDGVVTSCPNIWFDNVGNLLKTEGEKVFEKMKISRFRKLLLSKRPRLLACKKCFTPWELISFYFEDLISIEELCRIPIYQGVRTKKKLIRVKKLYQQNENKIH